MATTFLTLASLAQSLFKETDLEGVVVVKAASATVYAIFVDNTLNGAQQEFLKVFNTAGAVVFGTTVPDEVIMVPAGYKGLLALNATGKVYGTGLQVAMSQGAALANVTPPTSNVEVSIYFT